MSNRPKIFAIIAIIGFIAGVIALLIVENIEPWLENIAELSNIIKYIGAGIVGAILAIIMIIIWVRITRKDDNPYYY